MPTSLRLPADIETRIAGFGSRTGLTKSAVIVRSIEEFLARHAEPSSLHIYEEAMRNATNQRNRRRDSRPDSHEANPRDDVKADTLKAELARSPSKQLVIRSIRSKHAQRSARATSALATRRKAQATSR